MQHRSEVSLQVESQMVGAGESARAHGALEGSLAGVFPVVTGQLVGSGELPSAARPFAVEGLLTWRRGKIKTGH